MAKGRKNNLIARVKHWEAIKGTKGKKPGSEKK